MSKNIFKKLCLTLSIILACSFIPSMMPCNANIVQKLGEIEVNGRKEVCFDSLCGEMYGVKLHPKFYSDTAIVKIKPSNNASEYAVTIKCKDYADHNIGLIGPWDINFSTTKLPDPTVCVKMMDEGTKDTFEGSIDTNSDNFTCTSAASLIAPIGAIFATLLGLLAL